jgi:hypothetical protein
MERMQTKHCYRTLKKAEQQFECCTEEASKKSFRERLCLNELRAAEERRIWREFLKEFEPAHMQLR